MKQKTLLDTNIIIYYLNGDSQYGQKIADYLQTDQLDFYISSQNILETCSVMVRKYQVPLSEAQKNLSKLVKDLELNVIYPDSDTLPYWQKICHAKKRPIFDSFLVATMLTHGVTHIYTQNVRDFTSFDRISVVPL